MQNLETIVEQYGFSQVGILILTILVITIIVQHMDSVCNLHHFVHVAHWEPYLIANSISIYPISTKIRLYYIDCVS